MASKSSDITLKITKPKFDGSWELAKLTFRTYLNNFWFILKLTLPFYLLLEILKCLLIPNGDDHISSGYRYDSFTDAIFGNFLDPAVIFGVAYYLKSKTHPGVLEALRFGLRKWIHLFGQRFIAGIILVVGLLFFVVPGIYLGIAYSLILPVVCFEGSRPQKWLARSRELTFGNRGLILLSGALVGLIYLFVYLLLAGGFMLASWSTDLSPFGTVITETFSDLFTPLFTVLTLLLYLKLRANPKKKIKEPWFIRWAR